MNSLIVLTFVSEDYIPVGQNWLRHVETISPDAKVLIIALDRATEAAFPDNLVQYNPADEEGLAPLWRHRIEVLRKFLDQGYDVIHSDADAVWVRDPLPFLSECNAEMIFSQGTVWPPDVHAHHGLVLCCGFFYLRNTPSVRSFLSEVSHRVSLEKDDQASINRLVDENGVTWRIENPYNIDFRGKVFLASRKMIQSVVAVGPSVAVLPHHLFPRLVENLDQDVVVAHPLSEKNCEEKIEVLSKLGLWNVPQS